MNQRTLVLFAILLGFLGAACKRHPVATTKPVVEQEKAIKVAEQRFSPRYFTSRIKFRYQDPEQLLSGTANLRMVRDSALWVSVSAILGIEAARVLFLPNEVRFMNRIEGTRDTYSYDQFRQWTGMQLTLPMVQDIILGNNPFQDARPIGKREGADSSHYQYPNAQVVLLTSIQKLAALNATAPNNAGQTAVKYQAFKPVDASAQFATQKLVSVTNPKGWLSLELDHVKLDQPAERPETPW